MGIKTAQHNAKTSHWLQGPGNAGRRRHHCRRSRLLKQPHLLVRPIDRVAGELLQRQRVVVRRLKVTRLPRCSLHRATTLALRASEDALTATERQQLPGLSTDCMHNGVDSRSAVLLVDLRGVGCQSSALEHDKIACQNRIPSCDRSNHTIVT